MKAFDDLDWEAFRLAFDDDAVVLYPRALPERANGKLAVRSRGIFILCVNFWRYFHLMGAPILILWGQSQSKSLLLQPRHSHVMRKPTSEEDVDKLA